MIVKWPLQTQGRKLWIGALSLRTGDTEQTRKVYMTYISNVTSFYYCIYRTRLDIACDNLASLKEALVSEL
jgi:hypothetical protein